MLTECKRHGKSNKMLGNLLCNVYLCKKLAYGCESKNQRMV